MGAALDHPHRPPAPPPRANGEHQRPAPDEGEAQAAQGGEGLAGQHPDAELQRRGEELDEADRSRLSATVAMLRDASAVNADVLERQIELSTELMAAIAQEAQRLMGTRKAAYGAHGGLLGMDLPAPISLNTRL